VTGWDSLFPADRVRSRRADGAQGKSPNAIEIQSI
jgi:hypothetical protein